MKNNKIAIALYRKERKYTFFAIIIAVCLVFGMGCTKKTVSSREVTIAEQFGLAYAPVQIMRLHGNLEKAFPQVNIVWTTMGNTASIREAVVAGKVDIGFGAIPPFLIGYEHGMQWKILTGISQLPLGLITHNPGIHSIEDFSSTDTIAVPQPGSIQHILLSMALQRETGNAKGLDANLVTLSHPDGLHALENKSVTAHFTSPPYLFKELENPEMHQILSGKDAFGGIFSFTVGWVTDACITGKPEITKAIYTELQNSIHFIMNNPRQAAAELAPLYGVDPVTMEHYLSSNDMIYTTDINGIQQFSDFMLQEGYIKHEIPAIDMLLYRNLD